jgi:hypothetical protein
MPCNSAALGTTTGGEVVPGPFPKLENLKWDNSSDSNNIFLLHNKIIKIMGGVQKRE